MNLITHDDLLNPKFVFFSPVRTADLGPTQLADHVERAIIALDGRAPVAGDWALEVLAPANGFSTARVELWVNSLDDFTCTYGFLVSSDDGRQPFARGERTVVNIDPATRTPQKWSRDFVEAHADLVKSLPAYA